MTRNRNHLGNLWRLMAGLSAVTVFGQFAGCRESVVAAYYTGLENLAVGMVQAFFEAITPTITTAMNAPDLIHSVQCLLA